MLSDREGLAVLQGLREWNSTPVLVLSEQTTDDAKVAALDAGAGDYMTKPFSSAELLARLFVLQRSVLNEPDGPLLVEGELVANLVTHQIRISGRALRLTPKEEALFYVLARYAGTLLTHGWTFGLTLTGVIIVVAALTFFPALCLGPIVEHGLMIAGRAF